MIQSQFVTIATLAQVAATAFIVLECIETQSAMDFGLYVLYCFLRQGLWRCLRKIRQYAGQFHAVLRGSAIAPEDDASLSYSAGPQMEQNRNE